MFSGQVYDAVLKRLVKAYERVMSRVGDSLDENTLYGPLHSADSVRRFKDTVDKAVKAGGKVEFGGKVSSSEHIYFLMLTGFYFQSQRYFIHNLCNF